MFPILRWIPLAVAVAMGAGSPSTQTIPVELLTPIEIDRPKGTESTVTFVTIASPTPVTDQREGITSSTLPGSNCYPEPVGPNTPTGIAGCEREGRGIASHYGPGSGVAMNFCTWTYRHRHGCGSVRITSLDTGITVVAPVIDFCDCWTTTPDERIVDLQWGVVSALGLDTSQGLYRVEVWRVAVGPPYS